ncbi:hypothetical protein GSI_07604 [Ganoderma sinense ZZ0214-1]|uniref:Uncharacterized protein n=1 Tax=Ganoderma sinense ZZ0214-1 TaxID=1077348 RepID=A0A2G8S9I2_9APHY|nr:hypothetical protein GSI_07604 [Ganoderma sinense ZZ0214-1]
MAQPLFDQHPLEQYFRNTGETSEPMPGGSPDFAPIGEDDSEDDLHSSPPVDIQFPEFVVWAAQIAHDLLQSSSCSSRDNGFEERFKYDIISSSLLSSSLAAPTVTSRPSLTPEIPGKLDGGGGSVGDEHSPSGSNPDFPSPDSSAPLDSNFSGPESPIALLSIAVAFLSTGFHLLAIVFFAAAIYVRYVVQASHSTSDSLSQTLHALNELISAGNVWDSAVNEAIVLIENEERSIFYGPTSPQAPSSAVRIALQSSLFTTQTQCDNVRQLLSALTCPSSLSQLTEMYAPTSPIRPPISLAEPGSSPSSSTMRPFSHPSARRTSPTSGEINKRATWNGSYAALAGAGSPTAHLLSNRKKQNRRSNVISMFPPVSPRAGAFSSFSAPVTPEPISPEEGGTHLAGVLEEEDDTVEELGDKNYFGAAALDLQRKRRSVALEALGLPPPSYTPPKSPTRVGGRPLSLLSPAIPSASRLTSVHTTRHPLSLSGLHLALQGALAAKRYACSHLLALRFTEDEDDSYWENVRSVVALLSTTFSDASARLVEALGDAEKRRKKDEHPTPPRGNTPTPGGNGKEYVRGHERKNSPLRNDYTPRSLMELVSFAPMPSSMARLASHVETISAALHDAREHIDECVGALRDPPSRRASLDASNVQTHPAFQAYDRLRKELGFALRECERGRERLLDVLAPRPLAGALAEADDEDAAPHTPGLRHDSDSETSEKGPASPRVPNVNAGLGLTLSYGREDHEHDHDLDDATAHLLLTASSQHLPPPGVDQVFEADSGSGAAFARPRSKLTREERIRLAKARRASGRLLSASSVGAGSADFEAMPMPAPARERWGPGGEVVQELKDVIWKVGEKKRKMSQQVQMQGPRALDLEPAPTTPVLDLPVERAEGEEGEETEKDKDEAALRALPVPVPQRETSISIDVVEGSPVAEVGERAYSPPEATEFETEVEVESELAYLDSPPPSLSLSLRDPHADSCLMLESSSDADDTLWTAPHPTPTPAPSSGLVLEGESRLDMS